MTRLIIVGAGASGMMAAISAAKSNKDIDIISQNLLHHHHAPMQTEYQLFSFAPSHSNGLLIHSSFYCTELLP